MGLSRFFRNLQCSARLREPSIDYEGLTVPMQRLGMSRDVLVPLHDRLTSAQIQSIHDAMDVQGLYLKEAGPGRTVVIYAKAGGK